MNVEHIKEKPIESSQRQQDGLNQYLRTIRKYPLLTKEEEYDCVQRWQNNRDSQALQKLINSHLKLVAKIAFGYLGYGLPYSDLISEGSVGIMQAVDRFDIEKGFRFSTYASLWIRAAIKEYVVNVSAKSKQEPMKKSKKPYAEKL